MDAIECLITRRSIRHYSAEPVSRTDVRHIVEMARMVSSWENLQPVRYTAVFDEILKNRIADECARLSPWNTESIREAPVIMVLSYIMGLSGYEPDGTPSTTEGTHWQSFDTGMAAAYFCLAARALDMGTVIMGRYDEAAVRKIVGLPSEQKIACLIALGRPEVVPAAGDRLAVEKILTFK